MSPSPTPHRKKMQKQEFSLEFPTTEMIIKSLSVPFGCNFMSHKRISMTPRRRDLNRLLLWLIYITSLTIYHQFCRADGQSESGFLIDFMRVIDPNRSIWNSWNASRSGPCSGSWTGVRCNAHTNSITEITLENFHLRGKIDADPLCKLPSLQVLSLANNLIGGNISDSISKCTSMISLNLSSNLLSGRLPESLTSMTNLRILDLSNNNFSGPVPMFKHHLDFLNLNSTSSSSSFYSAPSNAGETRNREWFRGYMPLFLTLVIFTLFIFNSHRKTHQTSKEMVKQEPVKESPIKFPTVCVEEESKPRGKKLGLVFFGEEQQRFEIEDLLGSAADLQGQSFFSSLYRVTLKNNSVFAVKRLKKLQVSVEEFGHVMTHVGNLKHANILPLVAYHSSEEEKLLIYRYQRNRSMLSLLENYGEGKRDFYWRHRLAIAIGIARGLDYIYQVTQLRNVPHGNLKLSNILLSENEEPLISEYGFQSFLDPKRTCLYSSNGYKAPETKLTQKADIFSFGVILLELLTGKTIEKSGLDLPKWVRSMVREEWTGEVFDREVNRAGKQWAFPLLNVALKCVSQLPESRPNITEVLDKIEEVVNAQEDYSFTSTSSIESNYQDCSLLHTVISEASETPGLND